MRFPLGSLIAGIVGVAGGAAVGATIAHKITRHNVQRDMQSIRAKPEHIRNIAANFTRLLQQQTGDRFSSDLFAILTETGLASLDSANPTFSLNVARLNNLISPKGIYSGEMQEITQQFRHLLASLLEVLCTLPNPGNKEVMLEADEFGAYEINNAASTLSDVAVLTGIFTNLTTALLGVIVEVSAQPETTSEQMVEKIRLMEALQEYMRQCLFSKPMLELLGTVRHAIVKFFRDILKVDSKVQAAAQITITNFLQRAPRIVALLEKHYDRMKNQLVAEYLIKLTGQNLEKNLFVLTAMMSKTWTDMNDHRFTVDAMLDGKADPSGVKDKMYKAARFGAKGLLDALRVRGDVDRAVSEAVSVSHLKAFIEPIEHCHQYGETGLPEAKSLWLLQAQRVQISIMTNEISKAFRNMYAEADHCTPERAIYMLKILRALQRVDAKLVPQIRANAYFKEWVKYQCRSEMTRMAAASISFRLPGRDTAESLPLTQLSEEDRLLAQSLSQAPLRCSRTQNAKQVCSATTRAQLLQQTAISNVLGRTVDGLAQLKTQEYLAEASAETGAEFDAAGAAASREGSGYGGAVSSARAVELMPGGDIEELISCLIGADRDRVRLKASQDLERRQREEAKQQEFNETPVETSSDWLSQFSREYEEEFSQSQSDKSALVCMGYHRAVQLDARNVSLVLGKIESIRSYFPIIAEAFSEVRDTSSSKGSTAMQPSGLSKLKAIEDLVAKLEIRYQYFVLQGGFTSLRQLDSMVLLLKKITRGLGDAELKDIQTLVVVCKQFSIICNDINQALRNINNPNSLSREQQRARIREQQSDLEKAQSELTGLRIDLDNAAGREETLQTELLDAQAIIEKNTETLDQQKAESEKRIKALAEMRKDLEKTKSELGTAKQQMEAARSEMTLALKKEDTLFNEMVGTLTVQAERFTTKINKITEEQTEFLQRSQEKIKRIMEHRNARIQLVKTLEQSVEELREKINSTQGQSTQELHIGLEKMLEALANEEKQIATLDEWIDQLTSDIKQNDEKSNAEKEDLTVAQKALEREIEGFEKRHTANTKEGEDAIAHLNVVINNFAGILESTQSQIMKIRGLIESDLQSRQEIIHQIRTNRALITKLTEMLIKREVFNSTKKFNGFVYTGGLSAIFTSKKTHNNQTVPQAIRNFNLAILSLNIYARAITRGEQSEFEFVGRSQDAEGTPSAGRDALRDADKAFSKLIAVLAARRGRGVAVASRSLRTFAVYLEHAENTHLLHYTGQYLDRMAKEVFAEIIERQQQGPPGSCRAAQVESKEKEMYEQLMFQPTKDTLSPQARIAVRLQASAYWKERLDQLKEQRNTASFQAGREVVDGPVSGPTRVITISSEERTALEDAQRVLDEAQAAMERQLRDTKEHAPVQRAHRERASAAKSMPAAIPKNSDSIARCKQEIARLTGIINDLDNPGPGSGGGGAYSRQEYVEQLSKAKKELDSLNAEQSGQAHQKPAHSCKPRKETATERLRAAQLEKQERDAAKAVTGKGAARLLTSRARKGVFDTRGSGGTTGGKPVMSKEDMRAARVERFGKANPTQEKKGEPSSPGRSGKSPGKK